MENVENAVTGKKFDNNFDNKKAPQEKLDEDPKERVLLMWISLKKSNRLKRSKGIIMNVIYLQSGGPTAVINRSLAGALRYFKENVKDGHFYGCKNGIDGLIKGDLVDMTDMSIKDIEILEVTNGAYLGSSRTNLLHASEEVFARISEIIDKYELDGIMVNGGNDSMCTASILSKRFKVKCIGVPKTVDNDLFGIPYSPGYLTAANYVANCVLSIILDSKAYKKGKITLIETMGRDTGWLSLAATVLPSNVAPDGIYIPEDGFDLKEFVDKAKEVYNQKGYGMYVISEGIALKGGESIDSFGNRQVEGSCDVIAEYLSKEKIPNRVVRLSIPQRSSRAYPNELDDNIASFSGKEAMRLILEGETGFMAGYKLEGNNLLSNPIDLDIVAGKTRFPSKEDVEELKKRITLMPFIVL